MRQRLIKFHVFTIGIVGWRILLKNSVQVELFFLTSFDHASFKVTVRLNIRLPGFESLSKQKYPLRINWYGVPLPASFNEGSINACLIWRESAFI